MENVSDKLVYARRPVVEHYGLRSGISRIWLENQGHTLPKRNDFYKQCAILVEPVIFKQLESWQRISASVRDDSKAIGEQLKAFTEIKPKALCQKPIFVPYMKSLYVWT